MRRFSRVFCALSIVWTCHAQAQLPGQEVPRIDPKQLLEKIQQGDLGSLPPTYQTAITSAATAARNIAETGERAAEVSGLSVDTLQALGQQNIDAFIATLPRRDKALARTMLKAEWDPQGQGKLYYFVSRSMPAAVLRAYAAEAMATGGALILRGPRRGSSLQDFVEEAMLTFNAVEGAMVAQLDLNPNLFDLFKVDVVPAIVWTQRLGLEDMGTSCAPLDPAKGKTVLLTGSKGEEALAPYPGCEPAAEDQYYKISGVVSTWYALEAFQNAGAPKAAMDNLREELAASPAENPKALATIDRELEVSDMPKSLLRDWRQKLSTQNVMRSATGPVFSESGGDDAEYRKQLEAQIEKGLSRLR